jgi:hypothetical protein
MTRKSLTRFLGVTALGTALLFGSVQKLSSQVYGFLKFGPVFETETNYSLTINNVPEYIRDVPAHPDDLYKTNSEDVAPIANSVINWSTAGRLPALEMKAGIGVKKGVFDIKLGPRVSYEWGEFDSESQIKERNYLNHPGTDLRGEGAALTYYKFREGDKDITINVGGLAEASLNFDLSDGNEMFFLGPFAEYSFSTSEQKFGFENGWDRYNALEKKSSYDFVLNTFYQSIKLGIKAKLGPGTLSIYGGGSFLSPFNPSESVKEFNITTDAKQRFFCGVTNGMDIDTAWISNLLKR